MFYSGVTLVQTHTQENINWVSDLIVKALCGACTILLAIAVNSLNSMNSEIKDLSKSINQLSISSSVVSESQKTILIRVEKLEIETEKMRNMIRDQTVKIGLIEKSK